MGKAAGKAALGLWYDTQALEAAELYVSLFPNSKILDVTRHDSAVPVNGPDSPAELGTPFLVDFEIDGLRVQAINAGPIFQFNEAASIIIDCEDQDEVDRYWDALTADGGQPSQCGWLKDRFGLSWQIVPKQLGELMSSPDRDAAGRVFAAMMQMTKLDVAGLEAAARG
ncbi:VOC family protein [Luteimicrobium subarcticum]|uniref:Putative 3-demethylubiquinone-9 3-methyltransferase (Glyoxalase superfamily) n=1 Tax=Luteimicrobium subarcticum TaxID=620910 RepID=A0A2M8WJ28_9MICO|nr:VOC family protein [Luteimicrobium subarcticum]PJI90937.1 putative 3-demethylubiquinone-9 3-methyltransferase (glyoxalase superfamily) [Luteimicrobium subarcticum]